MMDSQLMPRSCRKSLGTFDGSSLSHFTASANLVWAISALTGEGLELLQSTIAEALQGALREANLHLDFSDGRKRAWLFEQEVVLEETQNEDGFDLRLRWSADQEAAFSRL